MSEALEKLTDAGWDILDVAELLLARAEAWKEAAEYLEESVEYPKYAYAQADEIDRLFEIARKLEE